MVYKSIKFGVCLLISTAAWGQQSRDYDKLVTEGNRYFEHQQYHLAIGFYKDALNLENRDPAIDYRLAECYRKTYNYAEAEPYYLKVCYTGQHLYPLSLYYYALMLKLNGNPRDAMERFDEFVALHQDNALMKEYVEQASIEIAGCGIAERDQEFFAGTKATQPAGTVNTPYNDFAPAIRNEYALVITSGRVASNRTRIDERYGEAFTDNYYFQRADSVWTDETRSEFAVTNSRYNDGSGSFTRTGEQYFFTRCEQECRIYETHVEGKGWSEPQPLGGQINYPGAESKQPAVSPGGDTLLFASNRPGGYGQFDIWISIKGKDHQWATAVNAGRNINTRASEIAPSLTTLPNTLFFSSDGHPGYGGFDLYVARKLSTGDTVLYNLSRPFNSVKDDCFITFNGGEIFWSSNRDGGKGGFDVYSSHTPSAIALVSKLSLKNRNDSRMVALTSRTARSENVHLLASRNEETIDYNDLTYEKKAAVNQMVENAVNNRQNQRQDFPALTEEEFTTLNQVARVRFHALLLQQKYASTLLTEVPAPEGNAAAGARSLTGQVLDASSGLILSSARILLTDENGEILKITSTNRSGQFRFTDIAATGPLFLRLETSSTNSSARAVVRNLQTMGSEKQSLLYVENVYFDFDHYVIRPEACQVLTELADFLKANPGAQVEIHAFADDRGSIPYNFELTQKRGQAVAAYLTRHGVDETSLAIIPKGKTAMTNSVSEAQRQYNRRAEFYINGISETFSPSVKTFIAKKNADWQMISKLTGIPVTELKALNGTQEDRVRAFQPVRLPIDAMRIPEPLFFAGI